MTKLTGSCLCGQISYQGETDVKMVVNCHCDDCRKASGSSYFTNVFVAQSDMTVTGDTISFSHKSDSGNDMTKVNCSKCGSPVYGLNSGREGVMVLRAGTLDQKELVKPGANVFMSSKIPATPVDGETKCFDKMPG